MKEENEIEKNASIVLKLTAIIVILLLALLAALVVLSSYIRSSHAQKEITIPTADSNGLFTDGARLLAVEVAKKKLELSLYWQAPEESQLKNHPKKTEIIYGKDLITHTSKYFGSNGQILARATNGMNCQNCHLEAGTKIFGNNYGSVAANYPKYRPRSGTSENIYKRVNDCFERSLNGKTLDTTSKEMQAIVAYIYWLGKDVKKGVKGEGSGFKNLPLIERAADPEKGKLVYADKCKRCHMENGEGKMNLTADAFTYPPLWGENSYNDGAGLYRISNFSKYVKYNMPEGVTYNYPQLSDEEAWDVAAFVNSKPRPHFETKTDWPNLKEKPFDVPFGPYVDGFSEVQHKYGPYAAIQKKLNDLKSK